MNANGNAPSRGKILKINMLMGLVQELIAVACGLVLPRFVLTYFGSAYNGIVNSITQFMAFSVVFRSGLGAVTNAALYKPLAERDFSTVSEIMVATKRFMTKVGYVLSAFILGFAAIYSLIVVGEFDYWFTFSLVLIMGASAFAENMFSIKYKILLQADQKYYVQTAAAIIAQLCATVFSIVLMVAGCGIHIVRLGHVLGFLTTPLTLKIYVDRHYAIDWKAASNDVAIKSRWDAFAQQLATVVNSNVPTVIMTPMLPLREISVYSVYNMVTRNMVQLLNSSLSGIKATFGNMIAREEHERLRKRFSDIEFLVFTCAAIVFATTAIMITPFVLVYTHNISDANYNQYGMGVLLSLVSMMTIIRLPYQMIVEAAGIFRETRNGAFLEIILHVVFSVLFIRLFGVIGVVMGGFVAAMFRNVQYAYIAHKRVLKRSLWVVIARYCGYLLMSAGIVLAAKMLVKPECSSFGAWISTALVVFCAVSAIVMGLNLIFQFKQCKSIFVYLMKKGRKK